MLKPAGRKAADRKYLKLVALIGFGAAIFVFYLAGVDTDKSATRPENSLTDSAENISAPVAVISPDSFTSGDQKNIRQIESDDGADLFTVDSDGQSVLPGLSEEDVKLLHARQQRDLEQLLGDLDAIVIESDDEDGAGMTVRELQILHGQQERELESEYDGEIVIPAGEDGSAALTVANLRAFHEEQEKNIDLTDYPDEVVIVGSDDGTVDRTRAEITALHVRQHIALESDTISMQDYTVPVTEAGDQVLTVEEVQNLHKSQSRD